MRIHRDLIKHSSIYGIGQVLSRLASILLLPVYTHFLCPADYGVIAILDLVAGMLGIIIGAGMVTAVSRFHFDSELRCSQNRVWYSGLAFVAGSATVLVLPACCCHQRVAAVTLGSHVVDGGYYYVLALLTLWFNCVGQLPEAYFRVRKWSRLSVGLSLLRLLMNIGLNIGFLAIWDMGVAGVLLGNLITSAVMTVLNCGVLAFHERPFAIQLSLLRRMLVFGSPLIVTAFMSLVMHQADRFLLRLFVDMDQVGVYSLAYQVGQAVNTLCLLPFAAIWGAVVYEIAAQPDFRRTYADIFEGFANGLALVMLAASLLAEPLLSLLTSADYSGAASIVPVVCLAYYLFSLHEHFRVPVLLAKKTLNLVPVFTLSAGVNIAANLVLIPLLGAAGAAWASVVTFATFSGFGLYQYRKIDRYPYPFARCLGVLAGMAATYVVCRSVLPGTTWWSLCLLLAVWLSWAAALFGRDCGHLMTWARRRRLDEADPPSNPSQADPPETISSPELVPAGASDRALL